MKQSKQEIKNRILTFKKMRGHQKPVSTSEVTKDLFSDIWRDHVDEVQTITRKMQIKTKNRNPKNAPDLSIDNTKRPRPISLHKSDE